MTEERQRPKRGMQDGNDRESSIARWLAIPIGSSDVTELVLTCWPAEEAPSILGRWPREDVRRELATTINVLIEAAAEDQGTTVRAKLAFVTEDGSEWCSKPFRAFCTRREFMRAENLDGTSLALLQQTQRHNEILLQRFIEKDTKSEDRVERMMAILERQNERLATALERTQDELDQAVETAQETAEVAQEVADEAERAVAEAAEAVANKDDKVALIFDLATKQLQQGS